MNDKNLNEIGLPLILFILPIFVLVAWYEIAAHSDNMHGCDYIGPIFFVLLLLMCWLAGFNLYRTVARLALERTWTKWYVRHSINASFAGLFLLSLATCFHEHASSRYILGVLGPRYYGLAVEKFSNQYWNLSCLLCCQWFLENFGNYVILPACALLAIGYAIERTQKSRAKSAVQGRE